MKKNSLKILSIFLTLPFLMGNAPAPQVFTNSYSKFDLTFISEEQVSESRYEQHFTLKNKGDGYINRIYIDDIESLEYYGSYSYGFQPYKPFAGCVYEPGFEGEIILSSSSKMPDVKKIKPKAEGFTDIVKNLEFEGTKEIAFISGPNSPTGDADYYYKIDLGIKLPDDYYQYGAILKIEYSGVTCYIPVSEGRGYTFQTTEKLDLHQVNIEEIVGIKSEPYLTHQLGCSADFSHVLTVVIVVFVIFALIISFGIFSAIFFPAMARRRRRRRALLEEQKKQNEKEP